MKYSLSNSLLYILIFFLPGGQGNTWNTTRQVDQDDSFHIYIYISIIFGPIIIQIVLRRTGAWLRRTGAWYFIKVYGALVFRSPTLFFKPLTSFCCSAVLLLCFFVCLFVFLLFSLLLLLLLCLYTSLLLCFCAFCVACFLLFLLLCSLCFSAWPASFLFCFFAFLLMPFYFY